MIGVKASCGGFAAAHSGKPLAYRSNLKCFPGGYASQFLRHSLRGKKNPGTGKAEPFRYVLRQSRKT
jgi:hypothetical protein